jgi:hypothetical protein
VLAVFLLQRHNQNDVEYSYGFRPGRKLIDLILLICFLEGFTITTDNAKKKKDNFEN